MSAKARTTQVSLQLDDFFHHTVATVWQKTGAAIVERRRQPGRGTSFRFLESLATAQARKTSPHR